MMIKKRYTSKFLARFISAAFLLFISFTISAQNIAVNTTGTAAAAANLFEVTQPAGAANNSVGIFASHLGTATNAYAIWAEATGATNKYAIVVPSTGGNVGIGTITPVYKLDMLGASNSGIRLKQGSQIAQPVVAGTFYSGLTFENTGTTHAWALGYGQGAGFSINYFNGTATYSNTLYMMPNGNVGLGTVTPAAKLELVDATQLVARLKFSGQEFYQAANTSTDGLSFLLGVNRANNRQLWIAESDKLTQNATNFALRFIPFAAVNAGVIDYLSLDATAYKNLALSPYGGNVGVGQITPLSKLHVASGLSGNTMTSTYSQLDVESSGDAGIMISNPNANIGRILFGTPGRQYGGLIRWDYTNAFLDFGTDLATGNIRFLTGSFSEKMRINSAGNVGIGTTTPTQKLDVAGNIKLGDNMMVEGDANFKVYRNLATLSINAAAPQGAFVINTTIPWNSAYMFTTTIKGYFYDATAPFEITLGGYMYTNDNFYNMGYVNIGGNQMAVRLGKNTAANTIAIILGAEASTYSYPKLTVSECKLGYSAPNDAYADGWSITQLTSLAAYSFIVSVPNVTTLPTGSGNYIQNQFASAQVANHYINGSSRALEVYCDSWFRNNATGTGLYNTATGRHFYSDGASYWSLTTGNGMIFRDAYASTVQGYVYNDGTNFGILNRGGAWGFGTSTTRSFVNQSLMVNGTGAPVQALDVNGSINIAAGNNLNHQNVPVLRLSDNSNTVVNPAVAGGSVYINWDRGANTIFGNGAGAAVARITAAGNLGVGLVPSGTYKVEVNGRIKTTSVNESSDIRWKKDISTLENSLTKVKELRGVNYKWRVDEFKDKDFDSDTQIGLIAQEVEKIFPELVCTDNNGYKSVEYSKLVAVLIEAIKDQQKIIDDQKSEAVLFRSDIQSLKASVEFLLEQAAKK